MRSGEIDVHKEYVQTNHYDHIMRLNVKAKFSIELLRGMRKALPFILSNTFSIFSRRQHLWVRISSAMFKIPFAKDLILPVNLPLELKAFMRIFSSDDWPFEEIFVKRVYEKYRMVKPGDVIIDCGAHIGLFTLLAAKIVGPEGFVIAIEPEQSNMKLLRYNVKINGLSNVIVVRAALSDKLGVTKLYLDSLGRSLSHSIILRKGSRTVDVSTITIDYLVKVLSLKRIDFIKMDIEGAELKALLGARKTLSIFEPYIAIEASHSEQIRRKVQLLLKKYGYKVKVEGSFIYAWK